MDPEDYVGRLRPAQVLDLLVEAWGAATEEDKRAFVKSHISEIEEIIENV